MIMIWFDRPIRTRLCICIRVYLRHLRGRRAEATLDVGKPVPDHGKLLPQVGVALFEHFLVGVSVLLDEHGGNRGGKHADQTDPHEHEDHGHRPPTLGNGKSVPVAHSGNGDDGPPQASG